MPLHSRRTSKPCQFRTSPRFSSPRCSLALVTNFSHSSLRVFRDLRTLSFFGSQLSRALSALCALLPKKPGVHLYPESERRASPPKPQRRRAISFISPTYEHQPRISLVSPTYAKTGGYAPTQKCRRADIRDFSPDISHFLALSAGAKGRTRRSFSGGGPPSFPPVFLRPSKFVLNLSPISQYTSLIGPPFS